MSSPKKQTSWVYIPQWIASAILLIAAYPKFSQHPDSIQVFTQLGMEPHGRYITGALELLAALMLLIPASAIRGAVLSTWLMTGALIAHTTHLGFTGPMGQLAVLAIITFMCSWLTIWGRRHEMEAIKKMFDKKK